MLTQTLLLALLASTPALASPFHHPAAAAAKRALPALHPRQTDIPSADPSDALPSAAIACASAISSVAASAPTTPPEIESWAVTHTPDSDDPCATPAIPASLSSAYKSYEGAFSSWIKEHGEELSSAIAMCPQEYRTLYDGFGGDECTARPGGNGSNGGGSGNGGSATAEAEGAENTGTGAAGGSGNGKEDGNGNGNGAGNGNGNGNGDPEEENAGHRETGFVGGVLAVVAFVGAVVVL